MNIENYDDDFYSKYKRKLRSISDRILLLDLNYYPVPNFTQCKILGSTNKEYSINIKIKCDQNTQILHGGELLDISCTCMDYQVRKKNCKHIYWFCRYNLKNDDMNPDSSNIMQLYEFLYYYLNLNLDINIRGRNEDCPICLEKIDYDEQNSVCCVNNCGNAVHNICWSRYKYITNSDKCVLCRNIIL
jgi:hypothetical protein